MTFPYPKYIRLFSIILYILSSNLYAGGMVIHMFQSEKAIAQLNDSDLKQLLSQNPNALYSGTQYPDAGYAPGFLGQEKHAWGEASHWAPFIEAYLEVVIEKCQGRYLSDTECGKLATHFLGAAAHGIQDQVFDGLFIPKVTEVDHKGQETTDIGIDMVVLREHSRNHSIPKPWYTPADALVEVYQSMDFTESEANRAQILIATKVSETGRYGESLIAPFLYWHYKKLMPWGSRNYMTYPGGVEYGGRITANFWKHLWKKLNGINDTEPANITTTPASGEQHVSINKPNTDNKISVTFDRYIIPSSINNTSFQVTDAQRHQIFGSIGLFAYSGQKHAEANMIQFKPYSSLEFGATYTVTMNSGILDEDGSSIFGIDGYQWQFTTENPEQYQQLNSQGFCLGLRKYEPSSSSIDVELQTCMETRHQQWYQNTNNQWHNRLRPDLCLDVDGGRALSWKRIEANTCSDSSLQQWQFDNTLNRLSLLNDNYAMGTFLNAWAGIELRLFRPRTHSRQQWEGTLTD